MNKCAIVTGGSRNIGQGIAITLAERGYDIAVTYATRRDGALETKQQIEERGGRCFMYEAHLEQAGDPERVIREAYKDLGRIDVMVCNAGREIRRSILNVTADEIDFLYQNNFRNYMLCAGAAARFMVRDKIPGSIVFITSVRANLAHPDDFLYGGLKASVERACKSMALDLSAWGIRVNCVAPGAIWDPKKHPQSLDTPFIKESIPLSRTGIPADIGEAVAFLAGEGAGYITGTTLLVDGGLSLPGMLEQEKATHWKHPHWSEKQYNEAMERLNNEYTD